MSVKRLVFIRPGETNWNLQGRFQGWVESPLNEYGRLQIERLANFIRNLGLTVLYSSDIRRAKESAEILASRLGYPPIYDERLRERSVGHWQGLTVPEIHGWYASEYAQFQKDPDNYQIPEGESLNQVRQRAQACLKEILKKHEKEEHITVGIVSHTITINLMLEMLLPEVDTAPRTFGNSSVTTVLNDGKAWRITADNDTAHLEGKIARVMPYDERGDKI
ncbi:MAG: histidine phosphatase family protein [Anaerolineae bacterium]|jgi:broad specificity phosphatase PhoE|nr:histidine phosphatase family protein [Anaerolineae bacterium]